jgi:hypothetical protein
MRWSSIFGVGKGAKNSLKMSMLRNVTEDNVRMKQVGHITSVGEGKNVYTILA